MANEYKVSQLAVEVLSANKGNARVSTIGVEVLRSIPHVPPPAASGRRQLSLRFGLGF